MPSFFASQIRIARPVSNLKEMQRFYAEGLGLALIGHFEDHDGISGIMLGMPDAGTHLEFTQHQEQIETRPPSADHLLVLYIANSSDYIRLCSHLEQLGFPPVAPANPYWRNSASTFEDPDGWRVVLVNRADFRKG